MIFTRRASAYVGLVALVMLLLAACGGEAAPTATVAPEATEAPAEPTQEETQTISNAVSVADQTLGDDNTVTIETVSSDTAGWLVVHAQADGGPGPVLGHAPVGAGENRDVAVEIDPAGATETLYAMLHVDAGAEGEYEFPGDDVPATDADGNVVTPSFNLTFANSVAVSDQSLAEDGTVTIEEVRSAGPGWLVVHAQADGAPGPVLGHTAVATGINQEVMVAIDAAEATETLYAMLHVDAGAEGEYEFPGDDVPATDAEGNVVTPAFSVSGLETAAESTGPTVQLSESPALGAYLADAAGMSLYTFAADAPGASNCSGGCAQAWPPLTVADPAALKAGEGVPGALGTIEREDGTLQVTYDEWPLYYWAADAAAGDTTGHNVGNVWAVARPTHHLFLGGNDELGRFLVGPDGLTLYRFNVDEPGLSNCTEQCAEAWPPLLIEEGQTPYGHAGVVGDLGTITRDDGTFQVTYQGMPLYYWAADQQPGDATGQGVNDVWFVLPPYTVGTSSSDELGDFLVAVNDMTLYLFTVDEEDQSNCYDGCAAAWPPLQVEANEVPVPGAGVDGAKLGVTERDDGTYQVTYDGSPLYFWASDEEPGDTTGHGVNDVWFVVAP